MQNTSTVPDFGIDKSLETNLICHTKKYDILLMNLDGERFVKSENEIMTIIHKSGKNNFKYGLVLSLGRYKGG